MAFNFRKETSAMLFFCEYYKIFRNTFFKGTPSDDCLYIASRFSIRLTYTRLVLQVFRSSLPEVNSQENRVPFYQSYSLKACNFTKGKLNFEHILDELKLFELKIIG